MSRGLRPSEYRKRLLQLADLLDSLPRKQFNYATFGSVMNKYAAMGNDPLKKPVECGTTACALGWAPTLPFASRNGYGNVCGVEQQGKVWLSMFHKNGVRITPLEVAHELFGLTNSESTYLFYPLNVLENENGQRVVGGPRQGPHDEASARTVANHIRRFVAWKAAQVHGSR